MIFKNPNEFSKSIYNNSIKNLNKQVISIDYKNKNIELLNIWRNSHKYPLHIFTKRLKNIKDKNNENILISQRLKRTSSIIKKLNRKYKGKKTTMKLTQMQDIAGCRVILEDINILNNFYINYFKNGNIKHKLKKINNYITNPKEDGYRSLHLVYEYFSDKNKKQYNGIIS